jgi:nitrogen fixation protein NifU and related proteins
MDLYREVILDHYHNPRGKGLQSKASFEAEEFNQMCGDRVVVQLDVHDGDVEAMRFEGHGCAISQAAASLLTEAIVHKKSDEVLQMGLADIQELLGIEVTPMRVTCALLPLSAVKRALTIPAYEHS